MNLLAKKPKKISKRLFSADVLFSHVNDDYGTPQKFFDTLNDEFNFVVDVAASSVNRKCAGYFGPDHPKRRYRDGLTVAWPEGGSFFNPPYSKSAAFVAKAVEEARKGHPSVGLLVPRTDTKWWHRYIWDRKRHLARPGIEIRFVKGRLKFEVFLNNEQRQMIVSLLNKAVAQDLYTDHIKAVSKQLKVPAQIVNAVYQGKPEVVTSAPFPSVVIVFEKPKFDEHDILKARVGWRKKITAKTKMKSWISPRL